MVENKPTKATTESRPKKIEELLAKVELLEAQFRELFNNEANARKELERKCNQFLSEQREEIVRLREELSRERQERQRRLINAKERFESE